MGLRDRFSGFMYGRYGVDQLSKFMLVVLIILCVLSFFCGGSVSSLLFVLIIALIVILYFRMFSRNTYKRAAENQRYLKLTSGIRSKFSRNKGVSKDQKKYYKFYNCPGCGQKIRVPKGRGKIQIRCPKCSEKFIRRT